MWKNVIKILVIVMFYSLISIMIFNSVVTYKNNDNQGNYKTLSYKLINDPSIVLKNNAYYFEGNYENNYIKISNIMFRVVSVLKTGHVLVVLDEPLVSLMWNEKIASYSKTNINKYLNNEFLSYFNKKLLTQVEFCDELCHETYVRLIDLKTYNNTLLNGETFIYHDTLMWLTDHDKEYAFAVNKNGIIKTDGNSINAVIPMLVLKNNITLIDGDGSAISPYIIEKPKIFELGKYIKLGNDLWIIDDYDKDTLYLQADFLINNGFITYRYDISNRIYDPNNDYSLAKYLNTKYYESLEYKSVLLKQIINAGIYDKSYKDIEKNQVESYIGLLDVTSMNFNKELDNYVYLTGYNGRIMLYKDRSIKEIDANITLPIRPTIRIEKKDVIEGEGTKDNPYLLNFEYEKD